MVVSFKYVTHILWYFALELKSKVKILSLTMRPDMERVPPLKHALCYTGPLSLGVPFQRFGGPGAGNFRKQKLAMATAERGRERSLRKECTHTGFYRETTLIFMSGFWTKSPN